MRHHMFWLVLGLVSVFSSSPALADGPPISPEPATTIAAGNVTYRLPFAFPSGEDILLALPAKVRPNNARIQCELVEYRLDTPRTYPGAGRASLAKAHFKCTVATDKSSAVVYIDRNSLILEINPETPAATGKK